MLLLICNLLCRTVGLSYVSSLMSRRFGKTAVSTRVPLTSHDFTTLAFLCLCTVFPSKDKTQKEEENKGLFSKFRKSRKKSEQVMQ